MTRKARTHTDLAQCAARSLHSLGTTLSAFVPPPTMESTRTVSHHGGGTCPSSSNTMPGASLALHTSGLSVLRTTSPRSATPLALQTWALSVLRTTSPRSAAPAQRTDAPAASPSLYYTFVGDRLCALYGFRRLRRWVVRELQLPANGLSQFVPRPQVARGLLGGSTRVATLHQSFSASLGCALKVARASRTAAGSRGSGSVAAAFGAAAAVQGWKWYVHKSMR
jgi:hypothetical protein